MVTTWRQPADSATPQPWQRLNTTCQPDTIAQAGLPESATPALTLAMIRNEWARTPFATPNLTLQPPRQETLVTLPVYVTVTWSPTGYQPGQTRTTTLLGRQIHMRPTLHHFNYDFGDGTQLTTSSPGGPYPTGDVQHPYPHSGHYPIQATATYGGEYSVDGGSWFPIGTTVQIPGPAVPCKSSPPKTDSSQTSKSPDSPGTACAPTSFTGSSS